MCLALPAKVIAIDTDNELAIVALGEVSKEISVALLDNVSINDYVLIHVGFAINKISPEEAQRTLQLFAQAGLKNEIP